MTEQNKEMNLALQFLEGTQMSVFLTGKAGTGKTTFLKKLQEICPKRMVVLAPTGVAAINAKGQTIHSFFQLPFSPFIPGMKNDEQKFFRMSKEKKSLIQTLDLLVIDEISMVRADVLDAIDDVLRRYRNRLLPFGGVQLLIIGDLQQLSPVAKPEEWQLLSNYYETPYFFSSHSLRQTNYVTIELKHIYRQANDLKFIEILGKIRNNRYDQDVINELNKRYLPDFHEPDGEQWIRLTTHNNIANKYNESRLEQLPDHAKSFNARIDGNFPEYAYPVDKTIRLKVGAQVMFVKNDTSASHLYYNGKIGVISSFMPDGIHVRCSNEPKDIVVNPVTWENTKYVINEETKEIEEKVDGTFTALPLRLAWAITIHKSQGLTFDHAILDINKSFAHGQVYVALSRCKSLDGIVLTSPINSNSIITDSIVDKYIDEALRKTEDVEKSLPELRTQYFYHLLCEQFDFKEIKQQTDHLYRVSCETLYNSCPQFIDMMYECNTALDKAIITVADKFRTQYTSIISNLGSSFAEDSLLQERINKACGYFKEKTKEILEKPLSVSLKVDNKANKKKVDGAFEKLRLSYLIKVATLTNTQAEGFTVRTYLRAKAKAALESMESPTEKRRRTKRKSKEDLLKELYRMRSEGKNATLP